MKSVNISWIHPYFRHRPRSVCELNEQLQNAVPIVHSWKCKRASDASSRRLFTILFTWKDSWNIYTLFIQVDYLRGMFQVAILIQCMQSFKHERRHGKIKWMRHQSNRNKNPPGSCLSTKGTFIYLFLRIQIFKFPFQLCWLCSLSFRATFTLVGFRAVDCALSLFFSSSVSRRLWLDFTPCTQFECKHFFSLRHRFVFYNAMHCAMCFSQMILQPLAT